MRKITLTLGMAIACMAGAVAWAGDDVVHLNGPADLAQLRTSNPNHYQRALKVINAANELCRPHAGEVEYTKSDAKNVSCARLLLRTSNPPKRDLSFRLDSTRYIALVTLTDDPPRLVAATSR